MAIVPAGSRDGFAELDVRTSAESFGRLIDAQQQLFHAQIEQLHRLVVTQCRLTGVNPLSQEMAAGSLSIKIGKRPRDLLNPKAIKYMQSVFSIKDTIGKKETREISALCGITITQVRDFFAGQRSRVRKLVRLSHEKASRLDVSKASDDLTISGQFLPVTKEAPVHVVDIMSAEASTLVPGNVEISVLGNIGNYIPGYMGNSIPGCLGNNIPGNLGNIVPGNLGNNIPGIIGNNISGNLVSSLPGNLVSNISRNLMSNIPGNLVNNIPGNLGNNFGIVDGQNAMTDASPLKPAEGGSSCSLQEETMPGVDSEDKKFLENIFNLMRKEGTFSGQVKLMEWVLQIRNSSVLNWFLTKGGITILANWLSQAAVEEQTTVLFVIFKVLCHLPLHKALPLQMSAILQAVNKLRFYKTSDISNRARILLSRWSKLFVRNQALKKSFTNQPKDVHKIIQKQRMSEILSDESWQSKIDVPEEILALPESSESSRKSEARLALKLLPASSDESSKKPGQSVSSSKTKERRKILLIEQPDRKTTARGFQVARSVPSNHSRPILVDDIQKAKMRAIFMQNKYGKTDASTSEQLPKAEELKAASASQPSKILPVSGVPMPPQLKRHEDKKLLIPTKKTSPHKVDFSVNSNPISSYTPSWEKLKSDQIRWHTPPAIRIDGLWKVGSGECSKEVGVQTERIRRERETFYANQKDIPPNPKEPWDIEMDFDDSLTLEIPTEQPPDVDVVEGMLCLPHPTKDKVDVSEGTLATTSAPPVSNGPPEPDLELLAVLLKNPDLVFALTSGQGNNLNDNQKVALLDMLKNNGVGLTGITNEMAGSSKEKSEPVSLPSPTPPSERNGWMSEAMPYAKISPAQPHFASAGSATTFPTLPAPVPYAEGASTSTASTSMAIRSQTPASGMPSQAPWNATTILSMPQVTVTINAPRHLPVLNSVLNSMVVKRPSAVLHHSLQTPTVYPHPQSHEAMSHAEHHPLSSHAAGPPSLWHEPLNFGQARCGSPSPSVPSFPPSYPTSLRVQPHVETLRPVASSGASAWSPGTSGFGRRDPTSDPWYGQSTDLSEVPGPSPHSFANQSNYGMYPNSPMRQPPIIPGHARERSELIGVSGRETWSLECSPVRSPDLRPGSSFSNSRREHGWDHRAEQRWNPGNRDHRRSGSSGRRRRERDRRR